MSLLNNQSSCSSCSLQVRVQQLESDNNEMQTNLQQSNEKIAEHDLLLQQNNEFQQMHLALVFERNKQKENNEELNKKLEESKIKVDKLNSDKENIQATFDEAAIYIFELENEIKFEIKKCKTAYLKNAKLVRKNKKLFEKVVCMKKIIKAKNKKNIKILDYINQFKLENENIIEEKDEEINKQKNNYLDQIDQLKLENENLAKNLQEKEGNICSINLQLNEANQKNQSLLEDIDQLNSEKRNLIKEFKEKIQVIKDQIKEANTSSNEKINLIEAKLGELYTNLDKLQNETEKPVIIVLAQRPFNKPTNNNDQHLFYFEIKITEKAENQK
uniref:Uncharacterized protein n=1 Tax=Meloidogyne javanica TaxID=6303 RepID=A0A915LSB6_MELJA